jgi:plastocyanin
MKRIILALFVLNFLFLTQAFSTTFTVHVGYMGLRVFFPNSITTAHVGDTVNWVWDSGILHTTTSTSVPTGAAAWDHPIDNGVSFSYPITVNGVYNYWCTTHGALFGMTGSISTISTEIQRTEIVANSFELAQNFPNPFNPSTIIKFSIPKSSFVTLKIYDISGKEIKTLVNNNLPIGEYNYTFNAVSISSGVYFYKIIAGDFTEIKSMALIK